MGRLKASAGEIDIAPSTGTWMTGYGNRITPSRGVHDPIMARAVLLDEGETKLAIISCDLIGLDPSTAASIRRRIAENTSIPKGNVLICCTHTHSGPASMRFRGAMGHIDEKWTAGAESRIVELVTTLPSKLKPARLVYSSTNVSGIGFNRQDESQPIDEELAAIAIDSPDGSPIATLMNYATHAVVLGPRNLEFSGDFPGAAARRLQKLRGGIGFYLQGASGDAEPVVQLKRGWGKGTFDDAREVGEQLADKAVETLQHVQATDEVMIHVARKVIDIPLDPPPSSEELSKIKAEFEKEHGRALSAQDPVAEQIALAMLEWAVNLERALEDNAVPDTVPSEIVAVRMNDLRIVAMPFEIYSGIGLDIKAKLRPHRTIFVGYANGLIGYLPTTWAKEQGGYGPNDACRWFASLLTPISSRAHELVVSEAVTLAKSL